ncbi:Galactosylceramide sulfotransferase [Thelohanellus kitauei]|uniref:Galactosylceramide sulfotransferase n=1 Tax=Thelohanellus kitauei TaxID=669202 RepID=A0A0C2M9A4_THEKT|nr:Galactosylceramide sulfotransferase [Thelohanellus kitauei]
MEHYMEFFENYTSIIQGAYGKNPNFFDLGFDEKQLSNKHYIRKLIRRIDQQFDLVMITELWEESLLLVQKKMCLSIDEIVVFDANVRVKSIPEISESLKDKILQFNDADHQLYQYFYQKLKEEAKEFHPSDFESLRQRKKFWTDICIGGREHKISYSNRKYLGYMLKNDIDHKYRDECERMVASEIEFVDMYTEKMNEDAANY